MSELRDLAQAIANRLVAIPELQYTEVDVSLTPRVQPRADDTPRVIITPAAQTYKRVARDVVGEVTTVNISVCAYIADAADNNSEAVDYCLEVVPGIIKSLFADELETDGRLYHIEDVTCAGAAFNDTDAPVEGGLYDADAIADAFIYATTIVLTLKRYLKMTAG